MKYEFKLFAMVTVSAMLALMLIPDFSTAIISVVSSQKFTNYSTNNWVKTSRFQTYSTNTQQQLNTKVSTTGLSSYAPITNPSFLGTQTFTNISSVGYNKAKAERVTCTSGGVAIPLTSPIVYLASDNDADLDNCTLAAGKTGQLLTLVYHSTENAGATLKVTPSAAFVGGATDYQFGGQADGIGTGINLVYTHSGWSIVGTTDRPYASNPAATGVASAGSSRYYARGDHVHSSGVAFGAYYASTADDIMSGLTGKAITSWTATSATNYRYTCKIAYQNGVTNGARFGVSVSSAPTLYNAIYRYSTTATSQVVIPVEYNSTTHTTGTNAYVSGLTGGNPVGFRPRIGWIEGWILTGSTSGTINAYVIQSGATANATAVTVFKGSSCWVY